MKELQIVLKIVIFILNIFKNGYLKYKLKEFGKVKANILNVKCIISSYIYIYIIEVTVHFNSASQLNFVVDTAVFVFVRIGCELIGRRTDEMKFLQIHIST